MHMFEDSKQAYVSGGEQVRGRSCRAFWVMVINLDFSLSDKESQGRFCVKERVDLI